MTRKRAILSLALLALIWILAIYTFWRTRLKKIQSTLNVDDIEKIVSDIAECIIPRTNTPGAKDAQVSKPIIRIVDHCLSKKDKKIFYNGITEIEDKSIQQFSHSFSLCSEAEKISIINLFSRRDDYFNPFIKKVKDKLFGQSFFSLFKSLVVTVYCTSEAGATIALAYDTVPVNYTPCVPYTEGQKSWALK